MNDRPPSFPLPSPVHQHQAYSSATASPRLGSFASSSSPSSDVHSQSSYTTLASSHGPKTPPSASHPVASSVLSSSLQTPLISGYEQYNHHHHHHHQLQLQHSQSHQATHHAMNQSPADMYYQQPHMNGGQAPPPPVSSGGMSQYNPHQQPTLLQPGPAQYPNPTQYNQYGYANGLTSPPTAAPVPSQMAANPHVLPLPGVPTQQSMQNYSGFDNTGQVAPPGMKPRVTATLWEDEGSLCFQVEARGICVARREDNHMINGTKLLNVAGMTRGRRDGILKSEKIRHVVKIGPMHLKGVWIPFERALDFANKEKITELLFPLFVHNIAALLYHPTNQNRTNQVMAAAERRKQEQNQLRNGSTPGLPSLQHHTGLALPGPQQTLPSHANMTTPGRSSLDRPHAFPTPPTSASGVMGGNMSASESFQWQQNVNGASANPMSIDTSLSNTRSMPATPATTPPGPPMQTMPYPSSNQGYDTSRSMYHHPTPASSQHTPSQQQTPHQSQQSHQGQSYPSSAPNSSPHDRNNMYGHNTAVAAANGYVKNDMPGTASSRTASLAGPSANEPVNVDHKASNGLMHSHNGHGNGVHDDEHEHETEYTHDNGAYDASRTQYNYSTQAPQVAALSSEHSHLSPDVSGGAGSHQAAAAAAGVSSGRSTPRSAAASQPYAYTQQGYSTPPRGPVASSTTATATAAAAQASSNLYNVVTNDRGNTNGTAQDVYATGPTDMAGAMPSSYTTQSLNGTSPPSGVKRGRDDDDDDRSSMDQKRRRTLMDPVMPPSVYDAANTMSRVTATPVGARRHA